MMNLYFSLCCYCLLRNYFCEAGSITTATFIYFDSVTQHNSSVSVISSTSVRHKLQCATLCGNDITCLAYSAVKNGSLICETYNTHFFENHGGLIQKVYNKFICLNGGTVIYNGKCSCIFGYHGGFCQYLAVDCTVDYDYRGPVTNPAEILALTPVSEVSECASQCLLTVNCLAFTIDQAPVLTCKMLKAQATEMGDGPLEGVCNRHKCLHGGADDIHGNCFCIGGYVGVYCERLMTDCSEGFLSGFYTGVLDIFPIWPAGSPAPFDATCWMQFDGRTFISRNKVSTTVFNKKWIRYKEGFGSVTSKSYWLGLENLHFLTRSGNNTIMIQVSYKGTYHQTSHFNFILGDESSGYSFNFTGYESSGTGIEDCFSALRGVPFSTKDQDNDGESAVNCALDHGAGGWYHGPSCTECNVLGRIFKPLNGLRLNIPNEAFWNPGLAGIAPYRTDMYILTTH